MLGNGLEVTAEYNSSTATCPESGNTILVLILYSLNDPPNCLRPGRCEKIRSRFQCTMLMFDTLVTYYTETQVGITLDGIVQVESMMLHLTGQYILLQIAG